MALADRQRFQSECAAAGIDPGHRHKRKHSMGDGLQPSGAVVVVNALPGTVRPTPAMNAVDFFTTASTGRYVVHALDSAAMAASTARFAELPEAEREGYLAAARADALRFEREKADVEAEATEAEAVADKAAGPLTT